MRTVPLFLLLIVLSAASCHNNNTPKQKPDQQIPDTSKFYPLETFFKDQIQYVDLRNFPLYRITTKNGKRDSAAISKDDFLRLSHVFLTHDISEPKVKALYKETVFHDLSTGSVTLNYTPINSDAEIQNIDVLLNDETNIVKRVFIRSQYTKGDTTISEQYNWKAGKSFQVNRTVTAKNGYTATELNYVNWNDQP